MTSLALAQERLIEFVLVDATGAPVVGLGNAFSVTVSKNGGVFAAGAGVKDEIGSGWYSYVVTAAEAGTLGPLALSITGAGAVQQNLLYDVEEAAITGSVAGALTTTTAQIQQVRRMTGEPTSATYDDTAIATYITAYPLMDENGESPRVPSDTQPGVMMTNPDWTATYDLNAAAADIWEEKAAVLAQDFDFSADNASYSRSQAYEQAMKMASRYRSRRSPKTITLVPDVARERTLETTVGTGGA